MCRRASWATRCRSILGQTLVVENVAGAGGATGTLRGKNATPDGYTIGLGHMGTNAAAVATNPKLPYDPRTDFDYLGIINLTPNLLIVRKDLPVSTLQEFTAYAKAKGKDLKMGHNGIGSLAHLTCLVYFPAHRRRAYLRRLSRLRTDDQRHPVRCHRRHLRSRRLRWRAMRRAARSRCSASRPTRALRLCRTYRHQLRAGCPHSRSRAGLAFTRQRVCPSPVLAKLRAAVLKAQEDPIVEKRFADIGGAVPPSEKRGGEYMIEARRQRGHPLGRGGEKGRRRGGEAVGGTAWAGALARRMLSEARKTGSDRSEE